MVPSERMEIARRVQWQKGALLRDPQVEQLRKQVIVIRWSHMEGPSLNG